MTKRITVLISGRGTNLAALLAAMKDGALGGAITRVVANVHGAAGLAIADAQGVATATVNHRMFASRDDFDAALVQEIDSGRPDLVVLAGFMRVLGTAFVRHYADRLINIHPSLLPLYPGLHTHRRALEGGVRIHGCTVHFVTPEVDVGPIIAQAAVPVRDDDDEASLSERVLAQEHLLLPAAVRWFCEGRLVIEGRRVRVNGVPHSADAAALRVPADQIAEHRP
ncbi:MAG TPA: phosphoribosylglycinamide formyltransferase [Casimicrobiaceae bacterium]|nr:phosphoribosylglycinamide formyltransferase [Casimicrobiaceae bacterium]